MDPRWFNDFVAFFKDMGVCPDGHSIDRIDVNGNYAPENCRWVPMAFQAKNKRTNVYFEFEGKRMILTDWARELGITASRLRSLLRRGRSFSEIVMTLSGV